MSYEEIKFLARGQEDVGTDVCHIISSCVKSLSVASSVERAYVRLDRTHGRQQINLVNPLGPVVGSNSLRLTGR